MQDTINAVVEGAVKVGEKENMEVHKVDKLDLLVELWSFTPGCNWMDVVEIRFRNGDPPQGKSNYLEVVQCHCGQLLFRYASLNHNAVHSFFSLHRSHYSRSKVFLHRSVPCLVPSNFHLQLSVFLCSFLW